jgi:transposase
MTYSVDFRRRVLEIKEKEKLTYRALSKHFSISVTSLIRWSKQLESKNKRNKAPSKINMEALKKDIKERPDDYLYERAKRFGVTPNGIWQAFKRLGVTYKKKPKTSQSGPRKTLYILPKASKI